MIFPQPFLNTFIKCYSIFWDCSMMFCHTCGIIFGDWWSQKVFPLTGFWECKKITTSWASLLTGEATASTAHPNPEAGHLYGTSFETNTYIYLCVSSSTASWNIHGFSCQLVSKSTLNIHKDTEEFSFMTSRPGDLFILNCSIISSLFFIHFFPSFKKFHSPSHE